MKTLPEAQLTQAIVNSIESETWIISPAIDYCNRFLPDPGVSGVRSMGPGVSMSLTHSERFLKLGWCDSGWWWYQLNTSTLEMLVVI